MNINERTPRPVHKLERIYSFCDSVRVKYIIRARLYAATGPRRRREDTQQVSCLRFRYDIYDAGITGSGPLLPARVCARIRSLIFYLFTFFLHRNTSLPVYTS